MAESTSEEFARIKTRIETGEFDDGASFHSFVESEIYPLLIDGSITSEQFSDLVVNWSGRNYPFPWKLKTSHIER